ncbi:hypothetical protein B0H16DRAFT_334998 [Mycena metata]|uniref:Uncharacterized protein n=1 Tax=Mycena metata TaxID=1033252 RepID=A0AAD7JLX5_9AGAR|nr:hypothetical protein B0H16DRAFT_334998 [Mycena metata]
MLLGCSRRARRKSRDCLLAQLACATTSPFRLLTPPLRPLTLPFCLPVPRPPVLSHPASAGRYSLPRAADIKTRGSAVPSARCRFRPSTSPPAPRVPPPPQPATWIDVSPRRPHHACSSDLGAARHPSPATHTRTTRYAHPGVLSTRLVPPQPRRIYGSLGKATMEYSMEWVKTRCVLTFVAAPSCSATPYVLDRTLLKVLPRCHLFLRASSSVVRTTKESK